MVPAFIIICLRTPSLKVNTIQATYIRHRWQQVAPLVLVELGRLNACDAHDVKEAEHLGWAAPTEDDGRTDQNVADWFPMTPGLALPTADVVSAAGDSSLHHRSDAAEFNLGLHGQALRAALQELLKAGLKYNVLVHRCLVSRWWRLCF